MVNLSKPAVTTLIYLSLVSIVAVGLGSLNLPSETQLILHAVRSEGTVLRPTCGDHNTVVFQFWASGRELKSSDQPIDDNCGRVAPNDRVVVWYVPDHPENNTLREPKALFENELISVAIAALIMPALITRSIIAAARTQRRRKLFQHLT